MDNFRKQLKIAEQAAKEAGNYLMKVLPEKRDIDKKGVVDLVTEADRQAEKLIHEVIAQAYPNDRFLAEEGTKSESDSEFVWIVDPLDDTVNYAHRYPVFCVSIALVKNDMPRIACINNPNLDECFTALKGSGAFLNNIPITVSQNAQLIDSLFATGFPYDIRESDDDNLNNFVQFYKKRAQAVRRAGSAALDLAYVACGRFDGFWEFELKPWHSAAGTLLVEEAGGMVTDFEGGEVGLFKGEMLTSNGKIHSLMWGVILEANR